MKVITLFCYNTEEGYVVSPVEPENVDYINKYRLVAEEGMTLINGDIITPCVDVESPDGWSEIAYEEDEKGGVIE